MIDTAYIIESADFRMYEACPEILTPDRKTYKPTVRIKYKKPRVYEKSSHKPLLPCEKWSGRKSCADIIAVEKQAREQGLSYGAFMAKKRGNAKI